MIVSWAKKYGHIVHSGPLTSRFGFAFYIFILIFIKILESGDEDVNWQITFM